MTIAYYEENSKLFIESTFNVNMSEFYEPFISFLPKNASILDAGCGSGRDSLAFQELGFNLTSFDASPSMVNFTKKIVNTPVYCHSFEAMNYDNEFNGIWACASLLHVPLTSLPEVFNKLNKALKNRGIIYLSFKYGEGQRTHSDGRIFTDMNEYLLHEILKSLPSLSIQKLWITSDKRANRSDEKWLNALLMKQ